jgi:type VI secretion system protein ImpM
VNTLTPQSIGWYGKLPTRGDFVGRGLPPGWLQVWDDWLQRAMSGAGLQLGADALGQRLLAMPPWQCIVVPRLPDEPVWCGVVAPATDRVGRVFPLLLAEAYDGQALDGAGLQPLQARALYLADWLDRFGALASPAAFEAGVAQLGSLHWPCRPAAGASAGDTVGGLRAAFPAAGSFWWCPEPVGTMPPPLVEDWPPRETLLLDWLGHAA